MKFCVRPFGGSEVLPTLFLSNTPRKQEDNCHKESNCHLQSNNSHFLRTEKLSLLPMNQSKLLDLLLHTATCYGSCGSNLQLSQSCQNMKQMISHVHDCKINECYICKDVNQLIRIHAMNCSLSPCPVLNCNLSR